MSESDESKPMGMTVKEAAHELRVTPPHVYELVRKGVIPAAHLGERIIISRQFITDLLAGKK